jgi:hypothetical protein
MACEGALASDLPNGMKAGEALHLSWRSEFTFRDGKIYRIIDVSWGMNSGKIYRHIHHYDSLLYW